MDFSSDELQRYARQVTMEHWGAEGQVRLASAHVFVAGVGGLGCAASLYLAAAGVGKLTLCDHDRIECSNLNRQILYGVDDIGREKAPTAAMKLRRFNSHVEVVPVVSAIDDAVAGELICGADLILDCLDSLKTRFVLNRGAIEARIPMVYAAVSELTGYLSFLSPPQTPCLECFLPHKEATDDPAVPGCTPGVLGSLQAMEAIKFLTGVGRNLTGRLLVMDGAEPRFDLVDIERDPGCHACRGLS